MDEKTKKTNEQEVNNPVQTCYLNRELSWLEFNLRVLQEAADHDNPLLERLKFLMIYQSNLEEFFRVRVGILTHREKLTPDRRDSLSGWTASEELEQILVKVSVQQSLAEGIWKSLKEELKKDGTDILDFKKISKVDELMCKKHFIGFRHLISPRIIEPGRRLPFLWNQESYVFAILGRDPNPRIVIIPLYRFPVYTAFELDGRQKIVLTSQLVRQFLPNLLKKEEVRESAVISVTRNADVFIEEHLDNDDFREKMTKMLRKRKRELPVRVRVFGKLSPASKALLAKKINIPEKYIFSTSIPFDLSFRSAIREKEGYKYEERKPARNIGLSKGQYFPYLEHNDILISCPFQNLVPFVDLLYEAVDDPDVISIKITLYRLSNSSKIAAALAYAADRGKDVLCLLELRARFDEQSNIDYSEMLEDAGCRVIYGLSDQKVHSKLCLITRQVDGNLKHITQVGTGNYNEVTSEQYTDLSLITSDEGAAEDALRIFTALEAGELPPETHSLWTAPLSFKNRLMEMMDREIAKGPKGRICIKINSLNNREIMKKLIKCSQAGVKVELFIRGICCLKPGIPGMTENITIKSVVGRWLEHSRIYSFGTGEDERMFIGSGDLLNRNLERRVEVFIEVKTEETKEQIREILAAFREDGEKARVMQPDGTYVRETGGKGTSSQERLYRYFHDRKVTPEPVVNPLEDLTVFDSMKLDEEPADSDGKPAGQTEEPAKPDEELTGPAEEPVELCEEPAEQAEDPEKCDENAAKPGEELAEQVEEPEEPEKPCEESAEQAEEPAEFVEELPEPVEAPAEPVEELAEPVEEPAENPEAPAENPEAPAETDSIGKSTEDPVKPASEETIAEPEEDLSKRQAKNQTAAVLNEKPKTVVPEPVTEAKENSKTYQPGTGVKDYGTKTQEAKKSRFKFLLKLFGRR